MGFGGRIGPCISGIDSGIGVIIVHDNVNYIHLFRPIGETAEFFYQKEIFDRRFPPT